MIIDVLTPEFDLQMGQRFDVGGCVGKVVEFDNDHVWIAGRYYFSDGDDEPCDFDEFKKKHYEPWKFKYKRLEIENNPKCRINRIVGPVWDISDIKPLEEM